MKQLMSTLSAFLMVMIVGIGAVQAQDSSIQVVPEEVTLEVEEQQQFEAFLIVNDSTRHDTTFQWSVADTTVGLIDSTGKFTARAEGETLVRAQLDTLSAEAEVEVKEHGERDHDDRLSISPKDTAVNVGSTVQYNATLRDTSGAVIDTSFQWRVFGQSVGTVDSTGLFTATNTGIGFVSASVGELNAMATVIVQDSTADTTGTQTITIIKPRPFGIAPVDSTVIREGESYKLSGFPFPLNLLNGGLLHFPHGSLSEDITLTMEMPNFAEIRGDSVTFKKDIITAAGFHVMVDDSIRSPYYFEEPIIVSLPYKRGLIHNVLGISPDQLGMFFYDPETGIDTSGISNVVVDSSSNRIFASVAHFSNVVLAPSETATSIEDKTGDEKPSAFKLQQNYPNPFNPTTTISYTIPADARVTLEVYNVLGKRVATLVDARQQRGQHQVQFNATNLSSGIYIYRIKAGTHTAVKKMTLMK